MNPLTVDKTFKGIDFTKSPLPKGEYDNCVFQNCVLVHAQLKEIIFTECQFLNCDLTMANINKSSFKEVKFKGCKLLGLHFENTNPFLFAVAFEDCMLNLSSFFKLGLKKTGFINCSLQEVDFVEADLTGAVFTNCNLSQAGFENTVLEKADFRSSYNFSIDPEQNKIRKAKFSKATIAGLLDRYEIEIE